MTANMEKITVYVCGTAFDHELGETQVETFASIEALKKKFPCWESCGIVEASITATKWIVEPDDSKRQKPLLT